MNSPNLSPPVQMYASRLPRNYVAVLMITLATLLGTMGVLLLRNSAHAQGQTQVTVPTVIKTASVDVAEIGQTFGYSITVHNTTTETARIPLIDPLPEEVELKIDTLQASIGDVLFEQATRQVKWLGTLKPDEQAVIHYQVIVRPQTDPAKCAGAIINKVFLLNAQLQPIEPAAAQVAVVKPCPDLGDAPDSTNHAGAGMSAYPGPIGARYPTVFDPITGAPSGPRHRFPKADAWLGPKVSGERDADWMPDEDLATNLSPSADDPDNDRYDDGVLRAPVVKQCVPTNMDVQVTVVGGVRERYINAWVDWNRDGDWEDFFDLCPGANASEWVVQDHVTNLPNGVHVVTLPVFLPVTFSTQSGDDHWVRINIAEVRAPLNPQTQRADGRGPPTGYKFGETEDYIVKFEQPGEPKLELRKTADLLQVSPGGFINYSITIFNSGSAPATGVILHDPIPANTSYVAGSATATTPTVSYNGGSNRIEWTGNIPAGGSVTINFKVQVSQQVPCDAVIRNLAAIVDANDKPLVEAFNVVKVNCPGQPILDIRKSANVTSVIPGGEIEYTIVVVNGGTGPAMGVTVHDPIPANTTFVAGSESASAPTISYDNVNNRIVWTGNLAVGDSVTIKFKVKVSENAPCDGVIHNRAGIVNAAGGQLQIAEVKTPIKCEEPPHPVLNIRKTADISVTTVGGTIEYTIVVVNSGNAPVVGVTVQDPIPSGALYVAGSANSTAPTVSYDNVNNKVDWTGNIPAGDSVTIKFKVTVGPNTQCDAPMVNRAAILNATGGILMGAEAKVWIGCKDQPVIVIEKRADPQIALPGGIVEYTVVIANIGTAPAAGVTMIDPIPTNTSFISGSLSSTAPVAVYDAGNNWVKWGGTIAAGSNVVVKFKVQISDKVGCGDGIRNEAAIVRADGAAGIAAVAWVKIDCPEPKLTIEKKVDQLQTVAGGTLEYTIVIANSGNAPALGVTMLDPIPAGTTFVVGSESATMPTVVYDAGNNWIKWGGDIPANSNVVVKFKVTVSLDVPCQFVIHNRVVAFQPNGLELITEARSVVICEPTERFSDFGDAPDSKSNHHAKNNTAYPGPVLGAFPTVWDSTPSAEGSGPHHAQANQYWLGKAVTPEKDADLLPDADAVTNILDNGLNDVADMDKADDGWLNPDAPLVNCREAKLRVRISRALIPPPVQRLYLNVWIDGNRDGDWNDTGECPGARSFEWIVQNWWIDPISAIPAGGFIDIDVPTVLIRNDKPDADSWLRFTLSEQKAIPDGVNLPDGRGPAAPNTFRLGETEDYYRKGVQSGQPGTISIEKKAESASDPVMVGDIVNYIVIVKHNGGTAPATTIMSDVLPAGVVLVGGPFVTELTPSAAPLVATYNPMIGPSGAVIWNGLLSPNGSVAISFRVRVRHCVDLLINRAVAENTDGKPVTAATETDVQCEVKAPGISLQKQVHLEGSDQPTTDGTIVTGGSATYVLNLTSTDGLSHTVTISDAIPAGMIAVAASSSSGVVNIINAGQTVVWTGVVGPNQPVTIKILVRLDAKIECDRRLVNVARWFSEGHSGSSNEAFLRFACRDLGDAPDSTNHPAAKMTAYPAVQGNFPTVFDSVPDRGPRHEIPRPFHLGKGVSFEVEADQGFDADTVNNIVPSLDKADLDKADDGLLKETINLKHCQVATLRVVVSIDPITLAMLPDKVGYLNLWLDSNRDGDWADSTDCPQSATGAPAKALEHIVIDQIIDVGALGPGVHTLAVNSTVPVAWLDADLQKPAWLRITLSERKSNKPLTTGTIQHGDGRGYDEPFRLGETEDYLLRGAATPQTDSDASINKRGEIWPDFDPTTQTRRWVVGWIINYANAGPGAASNVHVVDTLDANQTLIAEHSIPLVPHTQVGQVLDYNVGTLPAGGSGLVIIRASVPWNIAPGTVISNGAQVTSGNDGNTVNNSSTATVTVPILPPVIVNPLAGSTCSGTVVISGVAQPGVTIDLYVDSVLHSNLPTDASGHWGTTINGLSNGSHDFYVVAKMGASASDPSPVVTVIVDSSLFWDPISLRFEDDLGHTIIPSGRLDESGWSVFLRPGHTYTVSLRVCCNDENAQVTMQIGDRTVTLSDPDGDKVFTGSFTIGLDGRFTGAIRICVTCNLIRRCSDGQVTIDPEGTVFDVLSGLPIDSANVSCLQASVTAASGNATFSLWPAEEFDQINPQTVGVDGYFSFFTPAGSYRLNVSKGGYQSFVSTDLVVVDSPVHYDVPLTPIISKAADQVIVITGDGFEPAVVTVKPGAVIEWVNGDVVVHSSSSVSPTVSYTPASAAAFDATNGGWDSGLLNASESYKFQFNTVGTFTYADAANPSFTATVIVKEETTPVETTRKVFLPVVAR